jgi:hypothetical protein
VSPALVVPSTPAGLTRSFRAATALTSPETQPKLPLAFFPSFYLVLVRALVFSMAAVS